MQSTYLPKEIKDLFGSFSKEENKTEWEKQMEKLRELNNKIQGER